MSATEATAKPARTLPPVGVADAGAPDVEPDRGPATISAAFMTALVCVPVVIAVGLLTERPGRPVEPDRSTLTSPDADRASAPGTGLRGSMVEGATRPKG